MLINRINYEKSLINQEFCLGSNLDYCMISFNNQNGEGQASHLRFSRNNKYSGRQDGIFKPDWGLQNGLRSIDLKIWATNQFVVQLWSSTSQHKNEPGVTGHFCVSHRTSNMEIKNLKDKDLNALDGLFRQFWGESSDIDKMAEMFEHLSKDMDYVLVAA